MTDITIAICTRNRHASLRRTLASLTELSPISSEWEVLVVDNGSSDDTRAVIASFQDKLPIRWQVEPAPGLSNARNTAVEAARGRYIVWTDDDVVVDPEWLASYDRAFHDRPDAAIFGGPIVPVLEEPSVPWFRENIGLLDYPLACRNLGEQIILLSVAEDLLPFGANFAVRAKEQRDHRYDPDLGVGPGRQRLGEETVVMRSILDMGNIGYWLPEAKVEHMIGRERQNLRYIVRYYAAAGETAAYTGGLRHFALLFGVPRWLWRRAATRYAAYCLKRITSGPDVWLPRLIDFAQDKGAVSYWLRLKNSTQQ